MTTHTKTIIFVVGVLLGVVSGEVSMYASEVAVFAVILAVAQGVVYFLEKGGKRKRKKTSGVVDTARLFSFPLVTILFLVGLCIGIVRTQFVEEKINYVCEEGCTFDAVIVSSPESKNEYQIFKVHPWGYGDEMYDIQIRTSLYPKYTIGDTLAMTGKVLVPGVILPHGDTKNNNRGFDYQSYLRTKNVGSQMTYPQIEMVDSEAHSLTAILGRLKENMITRIGGYVASPASSLATGMLFGVSSMSEELLATFRTVGLSHIVVLSGFNIVIVIASILYILIFLPLVVRIVVASFVVVMFVIMVGAEASVVRATLMAFVSLLALLVGRAYVARQALLLSLFAIVMYEPYALIHDVSLHLSFLATMGLVYMSEPLKILLGKCFTHIQSLSLRELLVTTLSAYFATLPYVMYTFGTVSVCALIANILVVPFVPLAMLLSFLVVISSYLSETFSQVFGFVDTGLIACMIWVARIVESLPFSSYVLTISFLSMVAMYVFIFLCINYMYMKRDIARIQDSVVSINETRITVEKRNLTDIISY